MQEEPKIKSFVQQVEAMAKDYEDSIVLAVTQIETYLENLLKPKKEVVSEQPIQVEGQKRVFSVLAKQDFKDEIKPEIKDEVKNEVKEELKHEVKTEILQEIQPAHAAEKKDEIKNIHNEETQLDLIPQPKKDIVQTKELAIVPGIEAKDLKPKINYAKKYGKKIKTGIVAGAVGVKTFLDDAEDAVASTTHSAATTLKNAIQYRKYKKEKGFEFVLNNLSLAHEEEIRNGFDWKAFETISFPLNENGVKILKASLKKEPESFAELNTLVAMANSVYVLTKKGISVETLDKIGHAQTTRPNIFADILAHDELVTILQNLDKNLH